MIFERLLENENTAIYFNEWTTYRQAVTSYIMESIVTDTHMSACKKTDKATLAIWGAGQCSDIDISLLSNYFNLVLIDCEQEKINEARSKYIKSTSCICMDIPFWHINHDTYELFEAMLIDALPVDAIVQFIDECTSNQPILKYDTLPKFDYSIAVGLSSQLCSRFIALLSNYKDNYNDNELHFLYHYFSSLNTAAVKAMLEALKKMTRALMIIGYEIKAYNNDFTAAQQDLSLFSKFLHGDGRSFNDPLMKSSVSGNDVLQKELHSFVCATNKYVLSSQNFFIWNFNKYKQYLMHLVSISSLN
ncbi:MAG: hypothetical protein NC240_11405 [Clostridium sp.]|nr:hypothetical protein [Clostridium sp.]